MKIIDNNNEIINNIREIYKTAPAHKIHQLIAKHFIPSLEEKKENAEIPTPITLVNEMLDKIPDEFWKITNKVFEPCCGKGNFVMKIFEKFFNGLVLLYPDENKRCEVIIKECLYYADLTPMNVFITTEILKCEIQSKSDGVINYNFNKYTGDTLVIDTKQEFNVDKFDAVIGNPPYQNNQVNVGKRGGGDLLWNKFVINSINIIKENGYLCFVHPAGWRKPESNKSKYKNLFKLMTSENQIIYLEMHDTKDGIKTFGAGTRYDWYVLQKIKQYKNTIIKGDDGKLYDLDLNKWNFLPNYNFENVYKLIANDNEVRCQIIYNRTNYGSDNKKWVRKIKNEEYKYTLIHSTPKNGIRYMYSSKDDNGHFGIKKVIFGESGIYHSIIDIDGIYGMTQGTMGIEISNIDEGKKIKKYIESDEFKNILKSCSWSNFRIDWRLFTYFKKSFYEEINNEVIINENKQENKFEIIKIKRSNYYLIDNKLYKIKKDKTQGEYYCDYVDGEIILVNDKKRK